MAAGSVQEPRMPAARGLPEHLHPQRAGDQQRAEALRVARQFEEIFVRSMVQDLRKTSQFGGEDDGMFGGGPGADTYADWFDQHFAEHIGNSGQVDIAAVLMREFEQSHQIPPAPPKAPPLHTLLGKGGLDVAV